MPLEDQDLELEQDTGADTADVTGGAGDGGDRGDDKPRSLRDEIVHSVATLRERDGIEDEDKDERKPLARDPKTGRIVKGEQPNKPGAKPPVAPIPAKAGDAQTSAGAQPAQSGSTTAPNGWSAEAKAVWDKLPPAVQAAVTKREQDVVSGVRSLQGRFQAYETEIAKLDSVFQRNGHDRAGGLQTLVAWALAIEQNPIQAITQLAQSYGLRPNGAQQPNGTNGQTQLTRQPQLDIRSAVQPLIAPLQAEIQKLTQARTNEAQAQSDAFVNAWAKDKPHYQSVRGHMRDIVDTAVRNGTINDWLAQDGSPDLNKLYETAVFMNPETRQAVLAEQALGRQTQQRQAANKARRAGASLRPGAPANTNREPDRANMAPRDRLRHDIREAMEAVANR
jgi:hypothetical protein